MGAAAIVGALVSLVRFGSLLTDVRSAGFLLVAVALTGALAYVAFRRFGWIASLAVAWGLLIVHYLAISGYAQRFGSAGLIWPLVVGLGLVLGVGTFLEARRVMGFGRFILVAIVVGVGFVAASALFGGAMRGRAEGMAMRVNFAVGSLAGAAFGLGLEVVETLWFRRQVR